ncbi:hypothetical protein ACB496_15510 [Lelliottia nimipressuralis]|uniref:hypothetical protein n=1 Tax=Lelliottia nimipressuralis TaxID=69220 RepID=UPI00355725EF
MNNKLKLTLGTLPVLLSMLITPAHASLGRSSTHQLDFVLQSSAQSWVQVTPATGLISGKQLKNTKLAEAVIKGDGKAGYTDLAVKWDTSNGAIDPQKPAEYVLASTDNMSLDPIAVVLAIDPNGTAAATKGATSYVGAVAAQTTDLTLYVLMKSDQVVSPGTYHAALQAAAYTN